MITEKLSLLQTAAGSSIFKMLPSSLSGIPFHKDTPSITRYFSEGFPLHIAIHEISPLTEAPALYTVPHAHDDCDEINMIISPTKLIYKIQLGDREYTVYNNSSIWIPRGTLHSANVVKGSGYYIAIRIE